MALFGALQQVNQKQGVGTVDWQSGSGSLLGGAKHLMQQQQQQGGVQQPQQDVPPAGQMQQPAQRQVAQQQAGMQAGQQPQQQGLPPTGLQQQMQSLNQLYEGVAGIDQIGYNVREAQFMGGAPNRQAKELQMSRGAGGATSLDQLARNLAQQYGLPIGRGRLVDESGNFLKTPQQLADASGGEMTLGEAAAAMNAVARGVAGRQNEEQQRKGMAALETGMGQVQSRGRGSLATMMGGYYRDIADMYANQEYEAADFSYYIQKEQLDIQQELQRKQEELAKKQSRFGTIAGIGMGIAGIATGNPMLALGGFSSAAGSAAGTGWFG